MTNLALIAAFASVLAFAVVASGILVVSIGRALKTIPSAPARDHAPATKMPSLATLYVA